MRLLFGTPVADYIFPALLWLLSLGFLLFAMGFSPMSREMPVLVGWGTLVLTTIDLFSRTRLPSALALNRLLNPDIRSKDTAGKASSHARLAMAIAGIIGFGTALVLAGVVYAVPAFLFAALYWGGRCRFATSLLISAVATGLVWGLFAGVLKLDLFPGLLFGGDW